jgi:hypothetical protein
MMAGARFVAYAPQHGSSHTGKLQPEFFGSIQPVKVEFALR